MRFVLYTEKTIPQCLTAINERMQVKGTSTRPALDGWVEKGGAFALSLSAPVIGKFSRRTTLKAQAEREGSTTIIRGSVPSGAPREGQAIVFVALVLVALTIIGSGNVLVGLLLIPVAAYLYIPLHGDYQNSDVLLDEVQKTLKAKPTPPSHRPSVGAQRAAPALPSKPAKAPAAKAPKAKPAKGSAAAKRAGTPKPPATEFPPTTDEPPAAKPTPKAAAKPPAEKEPPTPPASEFPELPGEAPPKRSRSGAEAQP